MTMRLLLLTGITALLPACAGMGRNDSYPVPVTQETQKFAKGDKIVLDEIVGSKPQLEPGGVYLLSGHYCLESRPSARLALFSTGTDNRLRTKGYTNVVVQRGQGTFHMAFAVLGKGDLHVSMYAAKDQYGNGESLGDVYFRSPDRPFMFPRK